MGKHVCHMVTLKKYLIANKCLTRLLKKNTCICILSYRMEIFMFCVADLERYFAKKTKKEDYGFENGFRAEKRRMHSKTLFLITIKLT